MFVEWKPRPSIPLPDCPPGSPPGMDRAWGQPDLAAQAKDTAANAAPGRTVSQGSLPHPGHPIPKLQSSIACLIRTGVRSCSLPYPTTDQKHYINISPVTPTSPQCLSYCASMGRSMGSPTKEGLSVSLCPALGRPCSF